MNRTHLEHVVAALLIMAAVSGLVYLLGLPAGHWLGATAAVSFFVGR
ncbi:hypothetical protein [Pseudomonas cremoricolorata]|nr:hypothetical protein [Pseudomonas cremoricolorata]